MGESIPLSFPVEKVTRLRTLIDCVHVRFNLGKLDFACETKPRPREPLGANELLVMRGSGGPNRFRSRYNA